MSYNISKLIKIENKLNNLLLFYKKLKNLINIIIIIIIKKITIL